ncbi:MAG: PQQ-binding-like beta-propeller repeat protein [Acidobacteria bacterium]|nr:PQQ-binding-like beta-propeller repeat protein [Acidobacteriota bacterium]MYD71125.1 PQQ-binding-like beta-propeller repeat protein [Acidobacteriota bacterium]MYJ04274.1 PQQ-binding-like beta-propeller repeat protein [Acidobacteriota bacterium]
MMRVRRSGWRRAAMLGLALALAAGAAMLMAPAEAQEAARGNPYGEWRYQSADAWGTRYSPIDQIDADNFEDLEVAWVWRGDNFSPHPYYLSRSTPSYIDGVLYSVAGYRRTIVAIDPATGETLWTYREPETRRWQESMRASYGKGVGYGEVDGRGVIYVITPGFFLHALDAKTGEHLEGFGERVPIEGFPETGVVDLLKDLGHPYDPYEGIPMEIGYITSSSPPIVVNDTVVVGNSHEQGYSQSRIENVPGDILGYDARTGDHKWKFNVIPQSESEFGFDTWENDAWDWTGDVSSWAPLSADLERGIVYIPTNSPTIDYYGGFRPGNNLFGTSTIALDVETGQRVWHFQTVHHPIWNYDLPNVPILVDVNVDGQQVPMAIQTTKQGMTFAFNRETGEPVWPIEEREVPASIVPGEQLAETQPFPTWPAPLNPLGISEDDVIDLTPELKQEAVDIISGFRIGGPYMPPLPNNHTEERPWIACGAGGLNITHPATLDPETGYLYQSNGHACSGRTVRPGAEVDAEMHSCTSDSGECTTTGTTISDWVQGGGVAFSGPQGLPMYKPPFSKITAIDMNTGEHVFAIPVGEPSDRLKNHPSLQGVDLSGVGHERARPILMTTGSLLLATEGTSGPPVLNAHDKTTGEKLGSVELPATGQYGMMTYLHDGHQYIVVQIGQGGTFPGSLAALRLPLN